MMRDQANHLHFLPIIPPVAARTNNTAIVATIVDRLGYDSLTFAIVTGTNTDVDATFAVLVEDGNDNDLGDDGAAVADEHLVGTEALAGFTFADDVECRKIGYVGNKRYVRLTITPTGNDSGNIFVAAVAVLGRPHSMPTANPPQ